MRTFHSVPTRTPTPNPSPQGGGEHTEYEERERTEIAASSVTMTPRQFIGTFARFTTSLQRATSFFACAPNSSGVLAIMS